MIKYNRNDKQSIVLFAKKLINKSLRTLLDDDSITLYGGKGNFGQLVEEKYFGYKINSVSEPDFKEVGMELKCTPLKKLQNGEYKAKERLVLNIINYLEVIKEEFTLSSFYNKNQNILLIFYLYEKDKSVLDYLVKLVDEWKFPAEDLEVIKNDWQTIVDKINAGKAHELSEGDTFYLGACTKGANATSMRKQPFSDVPAMQRAFSFKQGYVNHIIASIVGEKKTGYGKLISSPQEVRKRSLDEIIVSKFKKYYGKSLEQIIQITGIVINPGAKGFTANLTKALLGIELDKEIEEFEKAELIVKTVRLKENLIPKEDMSFPYFKYTELVNQEWEDSEFKALLEHKFLIVFLKIHKGRLFFDKVKFWNMPYNDILEAKKVWESTRDLVMEGNIVHSVTGARRSTNFPSKAFSRVSHVRPHARTAFDTTPLPVRDKVTGSFEYTKHSFWLNASYIKEKIYLR